MDDPRFYSIEWDGEDHADDLMRTMHDGNLVPIVDEEAGGIIGYAIGQGHAAMIVRGLGHEVVIPFGA